MDEKTRRRGMKLLEKNNDKVYVLLLVVDNNEIPLANGIDVLELYKKGVEMAKVSDKLMIIKDHQNKIVWRSDDVKYIDSYLFKQKFEEARLGCKQILFSFMNDMNTYDKPTLDCIDYVFEDFYNEMKCFVFGEEEE